MPTCKYSYGWYHAYILVYTRFDSLDAVNVDKFQSSADKKWFTDQRFSKVKVKFMKKSHFYFLVIAYKDYQII